MQGIINILKPSGMTSQKCVSIVKNKLGIKKAGHLGTLDPSGTGVLPICIGKATKLFDYYLNKDKVYRAVFVFSKQTDTLDSDGKIILENENIPTYEQITEILPKFIGTFDQIPPNYSRKCVNGKRAYELARVNADFELKPKTITIYDIKCLYQLSKTAFLFEIHCSSGTYIRSIVRDLSNALNTVGYMGSIIRVKSGDFSINDAVMLENCTDKDIIALERVLSGLEKIIVDDKKYFHLANGVKINLHEDINKNNVVIYCKNELFGIADIQNGVITIKTNLR